MFAGRDNFCEVPMLPEQSNKHAVVMRKVTYFLMCRNGYAKCCNLVNICWLSVSDYPSWYALRLRDPPLGAKIVRHGENAIRLTSGLKEGCRSEFKFIDVDWPTVWGDDPFITTNLCALNHIILHQSQTSNFCRQTANTSHISSMTAYSAF